MRLNDALRVILIFYLKMLNFLIKSDAYLVWTVGAPNTPLNLFLLVDPLLLVTA